ncbi:MAG: hypothetical protein P4L56_03860 [Candidatus Sulfopaludibacter sp.]|nr:hypothetical protein [Candidatus Sulfopaludibacter sp.]
MNSKYKADPCAGDGECLVPPAEFVRLRYFYGQRLGVIDLSDEQSYLAGKQRFHNLRAHGVGVLCGLRAERYVFPQGGAATTPTTLLRVRRGAALDWCGREIVVGWDQCIDVGAWLAQYPKAQPPSGAAGLALWVALCYRECPSDPSPAPRDPCGCDAGGCEYARVREGFELKLVTEAEAAAIAAVGAAADARVPDPEGTLSGTLESAYERDVTLLAGADCPQYPAGTCLLLAKFEAELNAGGQVTDITVPDNTIPTRRSLLRTAALQQGLIEALAAAGNAGLTGAGPQLSTVTFAGGGPDSGTLAIDIQANGADLSRDPFAAPALLTVTVSMFAGGDWQAVPAFTTTYAAPAAPQPARIELQWAAGSRLPASHYRVYLQSNPATPPVDTKMRPLTPPSWARHYRLETDISGKLALAGSLF